MLVEGSIIFTRGDHSNNNVLRAATGILTYKTDVGVAYCLHTIVKSITTDILPHSQGNCQFSIMVTWSQAVSWTVTDFNLSHRISVQKWSFFNSALLHNSMYGNDHCLF